MWEPSEGLTPVQVSRKTSKEGVFKLIPVRYVGLNQVSRKRRDVLRSDRQLHCTSETDIILNVNSN